MDQFKKYTEDLKAQMLKAFASAEQKNAVEKIKEAQDSGTFKVVISTEDVDRHGEIVKVDGWDLENYKKNPIVLFGHNYWDLPIGMATDVYVKDGKLIAEGKFAPAEANPLAQQVRKLYDLGMLRTTSVGFIARDFDKNNPNVITLAELLEFSFVPVPANPNAIDIAKQNMLDVELLTAKGFFTNVKEGQPVENESEEAPKEENAEAPAEEEAPQEKPADEAPADEEQKAKQTVEEKVDEWEMREKKWEKFQAVDEIISAFWSVYFDDETPVEDFNKLLGETVALLVGLGADTETKEKLLSSIIAAKSYTKVKLSIIKDATEEKEEAPADEQPAEPQDDQKPTESAEKAPDSEPEDNDAEPEPQGEGEDSELTDDEQIKSMLEIRKVCKQLNNMSSHMLREFNKSLRR